MPETKKEPNQISETKTKKNEFVEIKFTGYVDNEIFDSNIEEDLKKLNREAKPEKIIVCIGQGMVVKGLDKALENKEIGKEYEIIVNSKEGFGERKRELIKTMPLSAFNNQKVIPKAGMVLALDNHVVKIIAVSGARVTADFNNPLAGKNIKYKFVIARMVNDEKEKVDSIFKLFFNFVPEYEINEKVIIKGNKNFEIDNMFKNKFKELIGKELEFEASKEKHKEDENNAITNQQQSL